jgi:uncharacterized protein YjbI with pentapeptide repeats
MGTLAEIWSADDALTGFLRKKEDSRQDFRGSHCAQEAPFPTRAVPACQSKPAPPVIIVRNRLGEEIDRVGSLEHKDLRFRDWRHVNLRGRNLDGSDLSGTNMLGADLRGASLNNCKLVGCEISYADVSGCDFTGSDMAGCLLYRSETQRAKFNNVVLSKDSDVPKIKMFQTRRVSA